MALINAQQAVQPFGAVQPRGFVAFGNASG
jgi:hypothetical protein